MAEAPFGTWPSPLSAELAAEGGPRFGDLALSHESGRTIVWYSVLEQGSQRVYRSSDGADAEAVPGITSARSRVNEYGGGALWCHGPTLFYVEDKDQCVYRLSPGDDGPVRLVEPSDPARAVRHASGAVSPDGTWMALEREIHAGPGQEGAEAINELAWLPVDGGEARTLWRGPDFAAAPAMSPDGGAIAWLQWNHPDMPWDGAELWAAGLENAPEGPRVLAPRRVAGGRGVAACLPRWSPDGTLWWCDDRDDAWLLRHSAAPGLPPDGSGDVAAALRQAEADVGEPRWVGGGSRFGFLGDDVLLAETHLGLDRLVLVPGGAGRSGEGDSGGDARLAPADGLPELSWAPLVAALGSGAALIAGRDTSPTSVLVRSGGRWADVAPSSWPLAEDSISTPRPVAFPTDGPGEAHGLFYPPCLEGYDGPDGQAPPLVVRIHGGPTAHARAELSPSVQFWTTRGFAVVEVNHRGSTGFGRSYRRLLDGGWGEVEVRDCIAAADFLAREGLVDPARCVIRGGSAGGFTALEAVCAPPTESGFHFAAATTLYGVTDLVALATDTHKFESRYLDGLVGRLPDDRAIYDQRSPIRHPEWIRVPVLLLQGLEDRVVPPQQAETLVAALEANGVPHEYRTYEGEGHGFRRTETVIDALEAELAFYRRVLVL